MYSFRSILYPLVAILLCCCSTIGPIALSQEHAEKKKRVIPDYLSGFEKRSVDLYREVLPTVVTIYTKRKIYLPGKQKQQQTLGSGVLISPECHVLTAAHVVDNADEIIVKTYDGVKRKAVLLFSETSADIAMIKLVTPEPDLKHATLGDSDALAVGQIAFAVGSPYGLENSFSVGHISGFRDFNRLYDGMIQAEFIQTDAAINSGNSGGPVFNSRGEVIAIASRILSASGGSQGLGFAVTINTAKQLLALEDRLWIGIEGIFLNKEMVAQLFNHDLDGGLLIQRVSPGSPADQAGLQGGIVPAKILGRDFLLGGDLIVRMGDQKACHSECLMANRKHLSGLDRIPVKFLRGGKLRGIVIDVSQSRRNFLKK
jgi:serine protease Do